MWRVLPDGFNQPLTRMEQTFELINDSHKIMATARVRAHAHHMRGRSTCPRC
jgi:hypothetical protein